MSNLNDFKKLATRTKVIQKRLIDNEPFEYTIDKDCFAYRFLIFSEADNFRFLTIFINGNPYRCNVIPAGQPFFNYTDYFNGQPYVSKSDIIEFRNTVVTTITFQLVMDCTITNNT